MAALGWTWEYTQRHMDLHRYAALRRHWRQRPPLRDMVQAWMGIEPPAPPAPPASEDEQIQQFINLFAAAGGRIQ